ncbi:dTMP kinase [Carnobacterium divergens]|uniref:dTMP kinase n=1 Tax=Carnobacterium divergens TaxID=2748 RepID=UPI0013A5AD11|nr:deoxynucleoside kinase [Carnobacterium divergens]MCO6019383.1 deoxynucleoside kinase [Carnobacterium divergens]
MNKDKGFLIAVEGNDGAGKSTQIKWLSKYYKSKGYKVLVARYNMSYTTLSAIKEGKKRKFSGEVNTYLHFMSIKDQFHQYVDFYLKKGYIVIFDRYIYSVVARGFARNVNNDVLNFLLQQCLKPNAILYLDIIPQKSINRLGDSINYWESGLDIFKNDSKEDSFIKFQTLVRIKMKELIKKEKNYIIVDGSEMKTDIFKQLIVFLKGYELL